MFLVAVDQATCSAATFAVAKVATEVLWPDLRSAWMVRPDRDDIVLELIADDPWPPLIAPVVEMG